MTAADLKQTVKLLVQPTVRIVLTDVVREGKPTLWADSLCRSLKTYSEIDGRDLVIYGVGSWDGPDEIEYGHVLITHDVADFGCGVPYGNKPVKSIGRQLARLVRLGSATDLDDDQVMAGLHGVPGLLKVYHGHTERSKDESDLFLVGHIAHFVGNDAPRIEKLFGKSKLAESGSWATEASYRERIIKYALSRRESAFSGTEKALAKIDEIAFEIRINREALAIGREVWREDVADVRQLGAEVKRICLDRNVPFDPIMAELVKIYPKIKVPLCKVPEESNLVRAVRLATDRPYPTEFPLLDAYGRAISLAYHLSRGNDGRTFYLAAETSGFIGVSNKWVRQYLKDMVRDGLAVVHDEAWSKGKQCVTYRFVGTALDPTEETTPMIEPEEPTAVSEQTPRRVRDTHPRSELGNKRSLRAMLDGVKPTPARNEGRPPAPRN